MAAFSEIMDWQKVHPGKMLREISILNSQSKIKTGNCLVERI